MDQITITLPDGSRRQYERGVTGRQIAESIGQRLANDALAIGVNGETWDLARPITGDASVRVYTWKDDEGKRAYWHSSAHLMA
jgi:threonyl-tRNA synthetase